jgi:outer membrane protein TolC
MTIGMTRIRKTALLTLALLAWPMGTAAWAATDKAPPARVVTVAFDDLPKLVRERNRAVSGSRKAAEAADARTGFLARSYLPSLRVEGGGESFQTGHFASTSQPFGAVEAKINLFRGGRDLLEGRARESEASGARSSTARTYLEELSAARRAYWRLAYARETAATLSGALERNEQSLAAANRRISRGLGTETDRLEFEIYRSQLKEEIESQQHEATLIEIELSSLLGFEPGTSFAAEKRIAHEHDESLLSAPFDPVSHPEVSVLKADEEAFAAKSRSAGLWWAPKLDLYGGYALHTQREREYPLREDRDERFVGFRLSFEIDWLQARAEAASLSLRTAGLEDQAAQRMRQADAQVRVAKGVLQHEHELIHGSEERIAQGNRYLARTLDEYNRGVKNSIDVLAAAQKWLSFERQYAERRRDYQFAKSDLLGLMGR